MTPPSTRVGDEELVARWRAGDPQAGNLLVARYLTRVNGFFRNAVSDSECADLTQDTFARLIPAMRRFDGTGTFRAYLFGIARRVLLGHLRVRYRDKDRFDPLTHTLEDIGGLSPSTAVNRATRSRALLTCIRNHLSIDQKLLLEAYYWYDMTARELSEVFGIPENTVRTRALSARKKLTECINKENSVTLSEVEVERDIIDLATVLEIGIGSIAAGDED